MITKNLARFQTNILSYFKLFEYKIILGCHKGFSNFYVDNLMLVA